MGVLLTVGLSVAADVNRDATLSLQESESTRVFTAAEAGVEKALQQGFNFEGNVTSDTVENIEGVDVSYDVTKVYVLETRLFQGISVSINVEGASDGDEVRLDWSREDNCTSENPASLLVSVYNDAGGVITVRHEAVKACDETNTNGMVASNTIDNRGYRRRYDVALQDGDTVVRVKPLFNDTHIRVAGKNWTLPVQGHVIRSEAVNEDGQETRIVQVNRSLPSAPSFMDYALVSGKTIVK
jgi:hypothetical protein